MLRRGILADTYDSIVDEEDVDEDDMSDQPVGAATAAEDRGGNPGSAPYGEGEEGADVADERAVEGAAAGAIRGGGAGKRTRRGKKQKRGQGFHK